MRTAPRTHAMIRAVFFDLDGTLLDTAPDMASCLNALLEEAGRAPLPLARIRPVVSHGATALVRLGFGLGPEDGEAFEHLRRRFLALYHRRLARETRLFPGMDSVLEALEAEGRSWGVVTNKPARFTEPLLNALGLDTRAACIVSGDTAPARKPDPRPLLHACGVTGVLPEECVYVGDARRDVEAAHAAGMPAAVALFGYLGETDEPAAWGADALVETPAALLDWIRSHG